MIRRLPLAAALLLAEALRLCKVEEPGKCYDFVRPAADGS